MSRWPPRSACSPNDLETNRKNTMTMTAIAPTLDAHTQAAWAALQVLGPEPLSLSLTPYLTAQPGRCSTCGHHPPTQGHSKNCERIRTWDAKKFPQLLIDSDICRDCGEPSERDGFSTRCIRRHWHWQAKPCARCGDAIDYTLPFKNPDKIINKGSLVVARIIPPAKAKALGCDLEVTNALWNKQPLHAGCRSANRTDQIEEEIS
jgi:hypothetical protein